MAKKGGWCPECEAEGADPRHTARQILCPKHRARRYRQTESGKAATERYEKSEKRKAASERYRNSEKGKATNKRAAIKRGSLSAITQAAQQHKEQ